MDIPMTVVVEASLTWRFVSALAFALYRRETLCRDETNDATCELLGNAEADGFADLVFLPAGISEMS